MSRKDNTIEKNINSMGKNVESHKSFNKDDVSHYSQDPRDLLFLNIKIGNRPYKALVDTGAEVSLIRQSIVKENNILISKSDAKVSYGNLHSIDILGSVKIDIDVIDFSVNTELEALVCENLQYDILLGYDAIRKIKMDICYSTNEIIIGEKAIKIKDDSKVKDIDTLDRELLEKNEHNYNISNYELNSEDKFYKMIQEYKDSNPNLGKIKDKNLEIILKENKIINCKPYPIENIYIESFRNEIRNLLEKGVIVESNSPYASPSFVIPKIMPEVRVIIDYRKLNQILVKSAYPFPDLKEKFEGIKSAKYFTTLDLNQGYYQLPIRKEDRYLTAFVTPFGHYEFTRVPFGLANAPQEFVRIMEGLLKDLEFVRVFIDDILIFSNSEEEHLHHVETVFKRLKENNISVNFSKCKFKLQEINYLGCIITSESIKPDLSEITKLKKLSKPKNKKEINKLVGYLNWFRPFIPNLSSRIASITDKLKDTHIFKWEDSDTQIIDSIYDSLFDSKLYFADYNKEFELFTDASDRGVGGILIQENKIIGIYSCKFNDYQLNYTIVEKELLAIVLSLQHFRKLIFGRKIIIFTDNKNITWLTSTFKTKQRLNRWKLLLEEYNAEIRHIEGLRNKGADFLSRIYNINIEKHSENYNNINYKCQIEDKNILKMKNKNMLKEYSSLAGEKILVDLKNRIVIPEDKADALIHYFHNFYEHPGAEKLYMTLKVMYYIDKFKERIQGYNNSCIKCKTSKTTAKKYGYITGDLTYNIPFECIAIDIYGPIIRRGKSTYVLSIVDMCSRWCEFIKLKDISTKEIYEKLNIYWLKKYPLPQKVIADRGRQFLSKYFIEKLNKLNIKISHITSYNPTSNSICERLHKTLGEAIRRNKRDKLSIILAKTGDNLRSTYHKSLGISPMKFLFNLEKINLVQKETEVSQEEVRLKATERMKEIAKERNMRCNSKRIKHEFKIGDSVLVENHGIKSKNDDRYIGPYRIIYVSKSKNSVIVLVGENALKYNIKQILPFKVGEDERDQNEVSGNVKEN